MKSNNFKFIPANSYCSFVTDGTHDSPKKENQGYKLVTSKHIRNNTLDLESAYFISENDYFEIQRRSKVDQWDVIISMIGEYCGFCYLEKETEPNYAVKNVGVFKTKCKLDGLWLYYYLNSDIGKEYLKKIKTGSSQPYLTLGGLRDLPILKLDDKDREGIIDILFKMDSKIELNNKINAELEAMAKLIYDYWFVQFDFPDAQGRPYKSSGGKMVYNEVLKREVPEGWEVKELSFICDFTTGKLDSNASVENGKYPFFTCSENPSLIDTFAYDCNAILIAGNNANGNFHVNKYSGKFNAYQRTYILTAKNEMFYEFIFMLIKKQMKFYKKRGAGSQTKFLTLNMLTDIKYLHPFEGTIQEYSRVMVKITEKTNVLLNENKELENLRDWLLPMLMNGQVRVGG